MARSDGFSVALICFIWTAIVVIVDPTGNFPAADDWAFFGSVEALVDRGELRFSDWGAMNLVTHIAWGSLFAAPFGTDYTVLRMSTLVALLLATLAAYSLARTARVDPAIARLIALTTMLNPLAMSLAFSFMTDITYLAMQLGAMALLAIGYQARSWVRVASGWALGVIALLSRQNGIAIAIGAAAEGLLRSRWNARRIGFALLPLAGFILVQWVYKTWLLSSGLAPKLYGRQEGDLLARLSADPVYVATEAIWPIVWGFFYIGLLALPVTSVLTLRLFGGLRSRGRFVAAGLFMLALALVLLVSLSKGLLFPMWGYTIRVEGLGNDLSGIEAQLGGPRMPNQIRLLLTIIASGGGLLLLVCLADFLRHWLQRWRNSADHAREGRSSTPREFDTGAFSLLVAGALFAPILFLDVRFDRYFIPILPCLLVAFAAAAPGWRPRPILTAAGAAALAMIALYSVVAMHDFMEMKRVQWQAYSDLTRSARPEHVDAGWVLNGPVSFGRFGRGRAADPKGGVFGWYERADYLVGTQNAPPGYTTVATYPVTRWLTWGEEGSPIYIQRHSSVRQGPVPSMRPDSLQ